MSATNKQMKRSNKRKNRKKSKSKKRKRSRERDLMGIDELQIKLENEINESSSLSAPPNSSGTNKSVQCQVYESIAALALCHNVTPIVTEDGRVNYEASSPDEIAMVKFTEKC